MEYKHLLLLLLTDVFCPHKCTSLINFGQMTCQSIFKCELCLTILVYTFTFKSFDLDKWTVGTP